MAKAGLTSTLHNRLAKYSAMVCYRATFSDDLLVDGLQKQQLGAKKRIAELVSYIVNPFFIGVILILLVSLKATADLSGAIKWSLILTSFSIIPIFLLAVYLVRHKKLDSVFANVRRQRTNIYTLSLVLGGISCGILIALNAPSIILALFVASFAVNVVFLCVNLRWKVSLHAAFTSGAATMLFVLYGFVAMASVALIPLVAWARMELDHHSLGQAITGALLPPSIMLVVFYFFGLV